ncbi:MAG: NeuD/PglB/VioB family sugar acetyltransferase [Clostridia bacterium]|jgi:sugar O-acyltransferase (sialic acid O-acetyltransferase NeuD family)|nr:NeuD/PglB/VioB family sugar acetyltransferase [Clostridia bacterium]
MNDVKKIVLIGAGGFGREVASMIEVLNEIKPTYELLGFLDDGSQYHDGVVINGYPWLGNHDWIVEHKAETVCTCCIANPKIKKKIQEELTEKGVVFETIIAYKGFGYIGPGTEIGPGCVFYGGVTISVDCKIGAGVVMNQMVNIGHDVSIGDYTTIMPFTGISGNCKVGETVNIGGHAFVVPGRKIGDGATVAAGSIVFANVKAGTTVLGNPAKRMRELE